MKSRHKIQGFSLVELVLVLIIGGMLLAGASNALINYMKQGKIESTNQRIEEINTAIQLYLNVNKKLPCPAPLNAQPNTATFAVEVNSDDCRSTSYAGTFRAGSGSNAVRIGALPVRSLNLPDQYIADGWKSRYIYAVTETLATDGSFTQGGGKISVVDNNGNSVVTPAGSAQYVIISLGENRAGAYNINGGSTGGCTASTKEYLNCAYNSATFRKTILISEASGANYFDDYVYAQNATADQFSMPVGAVVAFDLPACPTGWQDYTAGTGRVIIGNGNFHDNYTVGSRNWVSTKTYPLGQQGGYETWMMNIDEMPSHRHKILKSVGTDEARLVSFNHGTFDATKPKLMGLSDGASGPFAGMDNVGGGLPQANMPPYVALRYCKKL